MDKRYRVPVYMTFGVCAVLAGLALFFGLRPLWAYLIALNGATVVAFLIDKQRAQRSLGRLPESFLHVLELFGGTPASFAMQRIIRHKNRKKPYQWTFYGIVFLQAITLGYALHARWV